MVRPCIWQHWPRTDPARCTAAPLRPSASHFYKTAADSNRIRAKLEALAQDTYAPNNNVTKLQNRLGYRLRVANWRVIYDVNDTEIIIIVIKIGSCGEVYQ
jgi:mRNA interferase RelE/StbE